MLPLVKTGAHTCWMRRHGKRSGMDRHFAATFHPFSRWQEKKTPGLLRFMQFPPSHYLTLKSPGSQIRWRVKLGQVKISGCLLFPWQSEDLFGLVHASLPLRNKWCHLLLVACVDALEVNRNSCLLALGQMKWPWLWQISKKPTRWVTAGHGLKALACQWKRLEGLRKWMVGVTFPSKVLTVLILLFSREPRPPRGRWRACGNSLLL